MKKPNTYIWLLITIHAVGVGGLLLPETRNIVQKLTWVNILLSFIVLMAFHKKWQKEFIWSALLVMGSGFLIEVVGVKTGYIFGYYHYGPALGYSVWGVPLLMGIIWLMSIYLTRNIAELISKEPVLISITGALLMLALDYFLEPFAIRYDLWRWNRGTPPLHNYIGWFICSFVIHYLFLKGCKYPLNKLSVPLYFIQLAFFITLYLCNK